MTKRKCGSFNKLELLDLFIYLFLMRPFSADQIQAADLSEECVVWVDIILLYLLPTRNMHERQF